MSGAGNPEKQPSPLSTVYCDVGIYIGNKSFYQSKQHYFELRNYAMDLIKNPFSIFFPLGPST